jgi:DNA-binding LacI/PurR family transcriptional regulator
VSQPTIVDIAARAGVSKSLVSLVLRGSPKVSEESRRAVLRAAEELDYRPNAMARGLAQRRSSIFGVMLSDLHNTFFADVLDGIDARSRREGFRTLLATGHRKQSLEAEAIKALVELRTEGLILAAPRLSMPKIIEASRAVPVVLVSRPAREAVIDTVMTDEVAGAAAAVDHLVELGHRRIAHIDGGAGAGASARRSGYLRAMERHALGANAQVVRGDYTEAGGAAAVARLLDGGARPTAIFAANDLSALGALNALLQRGVRVPDEISLVGYDNTSLARLAHVDLTTIDQPRREIGSAAVELLLERINGGRRKPRRVVLSPALVLGRTTAEAPQP